MEGTGTESLGSTEALLRYPSDSYSHLSFEAYLWGNEDALSRMSRTLLFPQSQMIGPAGPIPMPLPMNAPRALDEHIPFLSELVFCRGVDSFIVYLGELLATIFDTQPNQLKSSVDNVSTELILEHADINDLTTTLAERTVDKLISKSLKDLAAVF